MPDGPVEVVPYNPRWPQMFEELRAVLQNALGILCRRIEHIGSTSVPGLDAKPIIDLDAVVAREDLPRAIETLGGVGYIHQGDLGIQGREAFAREAEDVPRAGRRRAWPAHHLYLCPEDSSELARHVAFRDCLRANQELATQYGTLKSDLAKRYKSDREAYTLAKTSFIENTLGLNSIS
ncbi:MAG: GrpB family protein [Candidatus Brocadiia bacterium]